MEPVLIPIWPDAGEAIGVGRTVMFRLIAEGEIPSVRVGRRRLIPVAGLRAFAEKLIAEQVPKGGGRAA